MTRLSLSPLAFLPPAPPLFKAEPCSGPQRAALPGLLLLSLVLQATAIGLDSPWL